MGLLGSRNKTTISNDWFQIIFLTCTLIIGLLLGAPLFQFVIKSSGIPLPLPLLVGVGIVGMVFAAVVVTRDAWLLGGFISLIVLATFNADIPFLPAANKYPTAIVGRFLLVHFPLIFLCLLAVAAGWYHDSPGVPVYLLGGFVVATVLSAIFGVRAKFIPTGFFVLYAVEIVAVVWLVEMAIRKDILTIKQLVTIFIFIVIGQAFVGVAQLLHQGSFGLSYLGEGGAYKRVWMSLPLVGSFSIGPYVAGFTGMSFTLSIFCATAIPIVASLAMREDGARRNLLLLSLVLLVSVIRFSAADSVRGALILSSLSYGALLFYLRSKDVLTISLPKRTKTKGACLVLLLLLIVLIPSHVTGNSFSTPMSSNSSPIEIASHSTTHNLASGESVGVTSQKTSKGSKSASAEMKTALKIGKVSSYERNAMSEGGKTAPVKPEESVTTANNTTKKVSIPFFSTANLGTRFQQYGVAFDVFADHPIFGIGGINFVHIAEDYGLPVPNGYSHPRLIHNTYFALLTETGLVGFSLYMGALICIGYYGWKLLNMNSTDPLLISGVLAGLVGIAAFGFWNPQIYNMKITFIFWILGGAIFGEYQKGKRQ
ncbi:MULTISPECIES: O-antigen ligase family protein [unclassified Haladaptatus]|uniref:O-antigen ligase family protein n=1 Tax=unclassified Haladaptatus TaxID=2622732 RepID=UPI00209BE0E5|nr:MULTISPECIES: O-antigen ligase family protein [unclassified Haladaptatus]MCO8246710.1 O-antigen ligase family protein [Haladaptatus sp. AB643]MCO8256358.1 O-antigen ligase family protein [Haladaptatus sp. AB618]